MVPDLQDVDDHRGGRLGWAVGRRCRRQDPRKTPPAEKVRQEPGYRTSRQARRHHRRLERHRSERWYSHLAFNDVILDRLCSF